MALRERALALAAVGQTRKALTYADRSRPSPKARKRSTSTPSPCSCGAGWRRRWADPRATTRSAPPRRRSRNWSGRSATPPRPPLTDSRPPAVEGPAEVVATARPGTRWGGFVLPLVGLVGVGVLLGDLIGRSGGYVLGYRLDAGGGAAAGAFWGRAVTPLVFLALGWLVRRGCGTTGPRRRGRRRPCPPRRRPPSGTGCRPCWRPSGSA